MIKNIINHTILLFIIGGLLGFIFETTLESIKQQKYVNRQGLWFTIFKPIYGISLIILTLLLHSINNPIYIFILGTIIGSTIEYISSIFQEKVFKTKSWDYSKKFANLNGRINLLYSLIWGILSLIWIKLLYPIYTNIYNYIYNNYTLTNTIYITAIFIVHDIIITCLITKRYQKRKLGIKANKKIDKIIDKYCKNTQFEKKFSNMKVKR